MKVFTLIIVFSKLLSLSLAVGIANNNVEPTRKEDAISMGKQEEETKLTETLDDNGDNGVVSDPIAEALGVLIRDTLSQLANHSLADKTIIIDNEIEDNSFIIEEVNGVQFSPIITVENDMQGSLHGNNNAESESGDVRRQNGVADFEGSLSDNNNAESENGNVIRQNGIIENGVDNTPQNVMEETSALGDEEKQQSVEKQLDYDNIILGYSHKEPKNVDYAPPPNAIIIHNKIRGNTVRRTESNGVIVVPNIYVVNDMSNALYNNNNAKSISGNVDRQNGVADFTEALTNNNNARSVNGDVLRQNGILNSLVSLLGIDELNGILSSSIHDAIVNENGSSDLTGLCDGSKCGTINSKDSGHRNLRGMR